MKQFIAIGYFNSSYNPLGKRFRLILKMSRSHVQKCYMDIIYKFCIDAFFQPHSVPNQMIS